MSYVRGLNRRKPDRGPSNGKDGLVRGDKAPESTGHEVGSVNVSNFSLHYLATGKSSSLEALRDISFSVTEREFVCIVGPSGCGKTTLLRALLGNAGGVIGNPRVVSYGQLEAVGRRLAGPGSVQSKRGDLRIGMVFQSPYLLPWLSTLRNVAAGLEFRSTPKAEATQRAMEVLRLVGLEGFESHKPRQLSGGMQQRVNLARALVVEPRLLLLDEPFAALDAYTRLYMQNELTRIMEEVQCSALFVTHDITEAIYLADRVIVLKPRPGEVLADIRIEFPRPRDKSIRGEPAFGSLVAQVTDLIESSLAGAQNAHKRTD